MDSICQRNVNVTVDRVGRVNILLSLKEKFNIVEKEKFEIYIENGNIVEKVVSKTNDGRSYTGSCHISCMDVAYDDLLEVRWYE